MKEIILKNKKINFKKLAAFGFVEDEKGYFYTTKILNGSFSVIINISKQNQIKAQVFEEQTNEEYTLHLIEGAKGAFVGQIKEEYNKILDSFYKNCFEKDVFKSDYALKIIEYINNKYNDELEYLWEKLPTAAICRRKDNKKWYIIFMIIPKNKLGFNDTTPVEIIDIRAKADEVEALVDNKKYFKGYHMNKKHWISLILDGSVKIEEIYHRIDKSYELALKNK